MTPISEISAEEFLQRTSQNPVRLIDVRSREEFAEVRVQGAVNIPLDEITLEAIQKAHADASEPLYLICHLGVRSMMACEFLAQNGMQNLVNIAGGTDACMTAGVPVGRGE